MPNNKITKALYRKRNNNIAYNGILLVLILSLLSSITNVEREVIIPFISVALLTTLVGCASLLFLIKRISIKKLKSPLFFSINIFGLLILFSTLYSKYPLLTASRSLQFIIVTNCLFLILSCIKESRKLFEDSAKITIAFTLVASIYGITLYHFGTFHSFNGIWFTSIQGQGFELSQRMYGHRISSFLGNPNPFGVLLMISSFACLYLFKSYKRRYYILVGLILLYCLLLTGSRASMLGLIWGSFFFLNYVYLRGSHGMSAIRLLIISLVLVIISYLLLNPEQMKIVFSLVGRKNNTLSGREVAWIAFMEQIKETPFFGIGYRISTESILEDGLINVSNSHNLYLSILSEVGILGFFSFICIFTLPIIHLLFKLNKKYMDVFKIIIISFLSSFLINQIFEDMFAPLSNLFIWTLLSLYFLISDEK